VINIEEKIPVLKVLKAIIFMCVYVCDFRSCDGDLILLFKVYGNCATPCMSHYRWAQSLRSCMFSHYVFVVIHTLYYSVEDRLGLE
jgi:hypothetical protein